MDRRVSSSKNSPFPAVIVHPNAIFLRGLQHTLEGAGHDVLATLETVDQLEEIPQHRKRPLLCIIGVSASQCDVKDLCQKIRNKLDDCIMVMLYTDYMRTQASDALAAGVAAYVSDNLSCAALVAALEYVSLGEVIFPPDPSGVFCIETSSKPIFDQPSQPHLSLREKEILKCVKDGLSNKCIARSVGISDATVKVHVKAVFRKIRVSNRVQAAVWARDHFDDRVEEYNYCDVESRVNGAFVRSLS